MCSKKQHVSLPIPSWAEYWWSWIIDDKTNRALYVSQIIAAGIRREDFEALLQSLSLRWSDKSFAKNIKAKMMIAWYKCVGAKSQGRQAQRRRAPDAGRRVMTNGGPEPKPELPNRTKPNEPRNIRPSKWLTGRSLCNRVQGRIYR